MNFRLEICILKAILRIRDRGGEEKEYDFLVISE